MGKEVRRDRRHGGDRFCRAGGTGGAGRSEWGVQLTPRILGHSYTGNNKGADLEDEVVLDM